MEVNIEKIYYSANTMHTNMQINNKIVCKQVNIFFTFICW